MQHIEMERAEFSISELASEFEVTPRADIEAQLSELLVFEKKVRKQLKETR